MGSEFIEKAAPTFKKSWGRARVDLATATLFTKTPVSTARTATADILCKALPEIGENLIVQPQGRALIARRGNTEVARIARPAPALLEAVNASCGIAKGTVEQVYPMARVADISLC